MSQQLQKHYLPPLETVLVKVQHSVQLRQAWRQQFRVWLLMTPMRNTHPAVSFVDVGYIKLRQPQHPPLPMEDFSGASSGSASWQLVHSDPVNEVADSFGISGSTSSFRFMPPSSTPPRPSLLSLPWRTPSVCLRFNSPFQLGHRGRQPTIARCLPRPEFGTPLAGPKHHPPRTQEAVQFPVAKAMPTFQSAASYAAYPKASASAVQASITTPTPSPLQEKPPPPARQAASAPRKLQPPPSGLTTSRDLHHVADAKNSALFAELCERHGTFSEVLQQLRGSHHGASIKARLLSKVSDTTAARYLRSVQLFFSAFEELGGQLADIDQGLFLDAFFALSRSTEDGPLSNSQNVIKALRWHKKLLGISCLPDLYGLAFSLLSPAATQEKRESTPALLSGLLGANPAFRVRQLGRVHLGRFLSSRDQCELTLCG